MLRLTRLSLFFTHRDAFCTGEKNAMLCYNSNRNLVLHRQSSMAHASGVSDIRLIPAAWRRI
jgi:hypothetical protein